MTAKDFRALEIKEGDFLLDLMIAEIGKEVGLRSSVYPKWIEAGRISETEAVRKYKTMFAVYRYLKQDFQATQLSHQLKSLIRAAYAGQLPTRTLELADGGIVTDLDYHVLQAVAVYVLGDVDEGLKRLWAYHAAWQASKKGG